MRKNARKRLLALCCVIVVAGTVLLGAVQEAPAEEEGEAEFERQIVVETAHPTIGSISVTGEYIGTVEPNQQVTVYPKTNGEVLTSNFNVGDYVEAGQVLLQVDTTSLEYTIAQTQAALSNAEAAAALSLEMAEYDLNVYYENLEDGTNSQLLAAEAQVQTAETQVLAAETQLATANASLRAARRTYRDSVSDYEDYYTDPQVDSLRDSVTQYEQAVEAAQIQLEAAQLQLETANASLQAVQSTVGNMEDSYNFAIRGSEISGNFADQYVALASLQNTLADATLRAPISGVIEARYLDAYDIATTATPAYVISNKESMTVSFQIPENTYSHMSIGDQVQIEKNGVMYNGAIYEISTMVDATGQFTVKATVQNPPADLYNGASVRIFAQSQKAENVVVIPLDALYYDNGVPYVYVERDSVAHRVEVQAGIYDAETVQIIDGITLNDTVITTWHSSLKDGAEIVVSNGVGSGSSSAQSAAAAAGDSEGQEDEDASGDGSIQAPSDDAGDDADLLDAEEVEAA